MKNRQYATETVTDANSADDQDHFFKYKCSSQTSSALPGVCSKIH